MIGLALMLAQAWTNAQEATGSIATKFDKDATLTPEQVQFVIQLARECGMTEPAEISTGHTRPLNRRFVTVKSREHVVDRRISYDRVSVYYSVWASLPKDKKAKQLNNFWVNPPYITKFQLAEISVIGKSFRVQMSEDISLEIAEKIFRRFAARKVRFQEVRDEWKLKGAESWEPGALTYDKGRNDYGVAFGNPVDCIARIKLSGDDVVITHGPENVVY